MAKRRASQTQRTPLMADLQFKLLRIVRRHDQMKTAFTDLKSQIKSGLLEAKDVFTSLSIPLMKLVGLKTEEMEQEGRSTTFFVDSDLQQQTYRSDVPESEITASSSFPARGSDRFQKFEEMKSYSTRARKEGNELMEKKKEQLQKLVYVLRKIEFQVNSSQNNLFQILNDHGLSLQKFFENSVFELSNVRRMNQTQGTTIDFTLKLLQVIFDQISLVLGSVEDGVKDLMGELAEHMCAPMVDYVKGLKAEMAVGTLKRLVDVVNEMEMVMVDGRLELEEERKKMRLELEEERKRVRLELEEERMKVRLEESRKLEALSRLRESEEKRRAMTEMVGFLLERKTKSNESFVPHKFITMEVEQTGDEMSSLLRVALKNKKGKVQLQTSPWGTEELLKIVPGKQSRQLGDKGKIAGMVEHVVKHRPRTRSYAPEQLSPGIPCTDYWPRLGSSPSVVDHQVKAQRHISSLKKIPVPTGKH